MPRGVPLTVEQLESLAQIYAITGSATAAAEELGVAVSTVTRALAALGEQKRAKLQRDAVAAGLLLAREKIETALDSVSDELADGLRTRSLEPTDINALVGALTKLSLVLSTVDRREEARRQGRLTRRKTLAEIAKLSERGGDQLTEEERLALRALLSRRPGGKVDHDGDGCSADPTVASDGDSSSDAAAGMGPTPDRP